MNSKMIITDDMTLEEKLDAVNAAIEGGAKEFNEKNGRPLDTPVDPALLTICDSCE